MGVRTVQTCDNCGEARDIDLRQRVAAQAGGWRTLNAGAKEATFCAACIRRFIEAALAGADQ